MKPKIHLVTRADDAGSCRSANEAILECVEAGLIKNVSFMAVGPELEHAVELLGGRDDIAYGVHVCFNSEWEEIKWGPLYGKVDSALTDEQGHYLPFPSDTKTQMERELEELKREQREWVGAGHPRDEPDYYGEISWQFENQYRLLEDLGLKISYVDEHMGISRAVPYIRSQIEQLCQWHGLVDAHFMPYLASTEATSDPFAALEERLKRATGDRYVWVTHPGKVAPDMNRFYLSRGEPGVVARERDAERQLLCDPRLPELFARWKVKPTRYDELPHS